MSDRKQPDERVKRCLQWYSLRFRDEPEDRILSEMKELGLGEFGSPKALYSKLAGDGFPVCRVCGETPAGPGHCGTPKKRQPDLGGGRRIRLPDAGDASALLRAALKELGTYVPLAAEEAWLEGDTEGGVFKGEHFVTQWVERDAPEVARREELTEEDWRELREERGTDPASDMVLQSRGEAAPGGVKRTPSALLGALVAAYSLTNRPLGPLIEALHPDPDLAPWEGIVDSSEKLQRAAGHLAARVRGGTVGRGRGVEEVAPEVQFLAWAARSRVRWRSRAHPPTRRCLKASRRGSPTWPASLTSRRSVILGPRAWSLRTSAPVGERSGNSGTPSACATALGTSSGSGTGASSTHHAPPSNPSTRCRAAARARRVLPAPRVRRT